MRRFLVVSALALAFSPALLAQPPQLVAPTGPLAPADERKALVVPEGFEVQLVAAEPDIQKPIQMAFDAKGRLWVTTSYHYPFAGPKGKSTDKLFVLSDFGPDGKARTVQTFADTLNIPIGILPLPDCNSCIVSSVGEILKLTDTDGDGKADKTEVLFTGFGNRDTHGMYNSFTHMPDGWVYACHGFSNDSTVKGKDGHEVKMQSGHTFRFRPDGSRIEVFTRGQVNPFGMAVDPWFNLYTADCHSKPITQLIPGAFYQSFGKPHDGLGFAPHVTTHDHGSTALCGLTWYAAGQFPKEYQGCLFLGNVVTNRINFDRIEWKGGTPVAHELPDFLVSKDPWFRPADIKLGPDGALYVTDFYNKIIGHYEVDLHHPGRDKARGRVWRIVWKGKDGQAPAPKTPFADLTKEPAEAVDALLGHPNLTVRLLATRELLRRPERAKDQKEGPQTPQEYTAHRLWVDEMPRGGKEQPKQLRAVTDPTARPLVADHEIRLRKAVAEWEREHKVTGDVEKQVIPNLAKLPPQVARAEVEEMAEFPKPEYVKPLVEFIQTLPPADTYQRHAARIALRNQLRVSDAAPWQPYLNFKDVPEKDSTLLADMALAIPTEIAAKYLDQWVASGRAPADRMPAATEHIGHYGTSREWSAVIRRVEKETDGRAVSAAHSFVKGLQAGGTRLPETGADILLSRVLAELSNGTPEGRLAALKFLSDLPAVLPTGYKFRGRPGVDPVPAAVATFSDDRHPDALRVAALEALVRLDSKAGYGSAEGLIDSPKTSPVIREKVALVLAASADRNHKQAAKDAIKSVPYRSGVVVATALAGSKAGGEILLDAVKQGKAPARLLQEKAVIDRLRAANVPDLDRQVADLTKGLQPADQKLAQLIKQRTTRFVAAKTDKEIGAKLFAKHCAACHRIADQGGKVGPQLDGIGARGLERLLEDTLDPNRNVDAAFRARVLNLADGTTKTGLMLRVEGEVLVLADNEGKEVRVPTKDIESNRETALSPMPANFGEAIPEAEFFHLVAYLLDQRAKDPPKK